MTVLEDAKDPTIRILSDIAQPFVIGFMYEKKYSERDAFQSYVREARQQGYSRCSNDQFSRGFFLSCYFNK